ncbi:hypothetical protein L7A47_31590, partial [Achromobacter xylosoxidans]|uniref:hypothetical protein n=1 Tax=Alcaligenes xylosoxydans xylosoxydans TaxID=85698 RepID=UPI001F0D8283
DVYKRQASGVGATAAAAGTVQTGCAELHALSVQAGECHGKRHSHPEVNPRIQAHFARELTANPTTIAPVENISSK